MVARSAAHRLRVQVLAIRGSDKAVGGSVGPGRGARYVPTAELRLALAEIEAESDRRFNAGTDPYLVLARGGELAG